MAVREMNILVAPLQKLKSMPLYQQQTATSDKSNKPGAAQVAASPTAQHMQGHRTCSNSRALVWKSRQ